MYFQHYWSCIISRLKRNPCFNFYFFMVGDVKHIMLKRPVLFLGCESPVRFFNSFIYYIVWLLIICGNPLGTDPLEEGKISSLCDLQPFLDHWNSFPPHRVLLFLVALHKKACIYMWYLHPYHISTK